MRILVACEESQAVTIWLIFAQARRPASRNVYQRPSKKPVENFPGIARAMEEQWSGVCELDTPGAVKP